jgi:hypothetical protein
MKWGLKEQYKESIKQRVHCFKGKQDLHKLMKTYKEKAHINKIKGEKDVLKQMSEIHISYNSYNWKNHSTLN